MNADGKGIVEWVPQILNFGFLGLSFLMVYMGYRLTRRVVEQGNNNQNTINITKYFLVIALVFMILAGPLQWVTLLITSRVQDKSIVLLVGANNPSWESKEYGEVYISIKGKLKAISNSMTEETFSERNEIKIELSEVVKKIEKIRQQLIKINESKKTPEVKEALGGG